MTYSIEPVTSSSQEEMLKFLREQENYSLFLLGNFENHGMHLTESPFSGNYKLIRYQGKVIGVFSLTRRGSLLIEVVAKFRVRRFSGLFWPIFEKVLKACQEEPIPLKGVIGNWEFCKNFWEYLKAQRIIRKEVFVSKEILYTVDLKNQDFPYQPNVRFLLENDYDQWKPLRLDYLIEEGLPNDLTEKQLMDLFLDKTRKKIAWGFFLNNTLVSIADLNAKALDLGQVGGVYTAPPFRQKGFSKAVMQQLVLDAKEHLFLRKLIIFTGEKNFAAQKLYKSLGVSEVGYFALLFGES